MCMPSNNAPEDAIDDGKNELEPQPHWSDERDPDREAIEEAEFLRFLEKRDAGDEAPRVSNA